MFPGRCFAAIVTTSLLTAGGFLLFSTTESPAAAASDACAAEVTVLPSPQAPWTGAPLRVMVITDQPVDGVLSLVAPDRSVAVKSSDRHGGPPYAWFAEVASPAAGTWHATLERGSSTDCSPVTREIIVSPRKPAPLATPPGSIWQVRNSWNSTYEALF